ncbi:MAG: hypothetical protein J0651_00430, partial [Actinobacteria bacterium]|nr:hypothetical protein [Actinomycetota bacterium]
VTGQIGFIQYARSTVSLSVAFVANGELILLTYDKQMARWKIGCELHFRLSNASRRCGSFHPPLTVRTEVYIANACDSRVEMWSLEADRFVYSLQHCELQ